MIVTCFIENQILAERLVCCQMSDLKCEFIKSFLTSSKVCKLYIWKNNGPFKGIYKSNDDFVQLTSIKAGWKI